MLSSGLVFAAAGCHKAASDGSASATTPDPITQLYIVGRILTVLNGPNHFEGLEVIHVCGDVGCATGIKDARVTINNALLAYNDALEYHGNSNEYTGNILIGAGARIDFMVAYHNFNYTASTTQYAANQAPTLLSPANNEHWFADGPNTVRWQVGASAPGATIFAGLRDADGKGAFPPGKTGRPGSNVAEIPINSTPSFFIPPNSIKVGSYFAYGGVGTPGIGNSGTAGIKISNTLPGSGITVGVIQGFNLLNVDP